MGNRQVWNGSEYKQDKFLIMLSLCQGSVVKHDTAVSAPSRPPSTYVAMQLGRFRTRSSVAKRTWDPVWNERLELCLDAPPDFVSILLFRRHKKIRNKETLIGSALINFNQEQWELEKTEFNWIQLTDVLDSSLAAELQVSVSCKILHPDVGLDNDASIYYGISHFLRIEVKRAVNLLKIKEKSKQRRNDDLRDDMENVDMPPQYQIPYRGKKEKQPKSVTGKKITCKISFGNQVFVTKPAEGSSPTWSEICWIYFSESRHSDYKLNFEVFKRSSRIGSAQIDSSDVLDWIDGNVDLTMNLLNSVANTDAELKQDEKDEDGESRGTLYVTAQLITKAQIEKTIFKKLIGFIATEDEDRNRQGLSRIELSSILTVVDPNLTKEQFNQLWEIAEKDIDGLLHEDQLFVLLNHIQFRKLGLAKRMLTLWFEASTLEDSVLDNLMKTSTQFQKESSRSKVIVIERHTGAFVQEHIPGYIKMALRMMFSNVIGRKVASSNRTTRFLRRLSVAQGLKYDSPGSVNQIPVFIQTHNLDLREFSRPIEDYENFNEFFARELRNIDILRPLAAPDDDSVAVTPADCRMVVFPETYDATKLWIKGKNFTIERLLAASTDSFSKYFVGGSVCIARLAPQDYHRWHNPVQGIFGPTYPVPGVLYTVNPIAVRRPGVDVFTQNKRHVCLIDTEAFGAIVCVVVAATMVGTMEIFGETGGICIKGEQHGRFLFGGSTIILLFQPNTIEFEEDLVTNSLRLGKGVDHPLETLVKVRSPLGRALNPGCRIIDMEVDIPYAEVDSEEKSDDLDIPEWGYQHL